MSYYNQVSPNYSYAQPVEMSNSRPTTDQYQEALSITNAKFNASRTFEFEDDVEFCPVLSEEIIQYAKMTTFPVSPFNDNQTTPSSVSSSSSHFEHNYHSGFHLRTSQGPAVSSPMYYMGSPVSRQYDSSVGGGSKRIRSDYSKIELDYSGSSSGPGSQELPLQYTNHW